MFKANTTAKMGLEPMTHCLKVSRSTLLSYFANENFQPTKILKTRTVMVFVKLVKVPYKLFSSICSILYLLITKANY